MPIAADLAPAVGAPGREPAWQQEPRDASKRRAADREFDLVGVGLVAAFAAWTVFVGLFTGGDPIPVLALVGAALVTFRVVRSFSVRKPWLAPAAVIMAGALLPLVPVGGTLATGQRFGPLGYANASALFYVVVAAAGGMLAVKAEGPLMRLVGVLAVPAAAGIVAVSGSEAAVGLLLLLPVAAFARRPPAVRRFVLGGAILVLGAVVTTVLLGMLHADPGRQTLEDLAGSALTERRLDLWRDALEIASHAPATGVGPGEFRSHSPTSLRDQDAIAAHDEYLQVTAELGLPGLLLALALTLWAFGRVHRAGLDPAASFAGAALTAVGIHASVDYVLHAPAILVAVVTLLGAVSASSLPAGPMPNLTGRRLRP
ncbi:MAG: O-antigen ligase family protein [Actinomycetota bacterium]|nr:O-antigen ligase family protein [Actinomycetota bacterium]